MILYMRENKLYTSLTAIIIPHHKTSHLDLKLETLVKKLVFAITLLLKFLHSNNLLFFGFFFYCWPLQDFKTINE